MRVVTGGIIHESNTFHPINTKLDAFIKGYDPTKVISGKSDEILKVFPKNITVIQTFYATAIPSGPVAKKAYLNMKEELLNSIKNIDEIDGICLRLHGSMEVEEIGDGERDLIQSIRDVVGEAPLISVSFDLHGNIPLDLIEFADILTAYRTAPHIDAIETMKRAASMLVYCLKKKLRPEPVIVKPPIVLPGEFVVTGIEPAYRLYQQLQEIDRCPGVLDSSLLVGFPWADTPHTSASAVVIAEGEKYKKEAYRLACQLAKAYWDKRREFHLEMDSGSIDESIRTAKRSPKKPFFISDSGDNVAAGAAGDVPIFVEKLISMKVDDAVVGGVVDPEAVNVCKEARVGSRLRLEIGGKLDRVNGYPLEVGCKIMNLTEDGAVVRIDGVDVILTSQLRAFTTLDSFRFYGVDPTNRKIVVVKLGYLFPELRKIAASTMMALSPGFSNLNINQLDYKRVNRPLFPLDQDFSWEPPSM